MEGVLGAGQAGIIVSQSSHRNQFIALLGGSSCFCFGEKCLTPRGPWGRAFWRYIFGLILQEPKQAKKRTPTMLKNPPDQQRITSIIGGTFLNYFCKNPNKQKKRTPTMLKNPPDQQRITSIIAKKTRSLNTGSPNDQASLDMM